MKKKAKRFWRNFGPSLVLLEICACLALRNNPLFWQFVCLGFLAVNAVIITHLLGIKIKLEQHNAKVDADAKAANKKQAPVTAPEPIAVGNVVPALA